MCVKRPETTTTTTMAKVAGKWQIAAAVDHATLKSATTSDCGGSGHGSPVQCLKFGSFSSAHFPVWADGALAVATKSFLAQMTVPALLLLLQLYSANTLGHRSLAVVPKLRTLVGSWCVAEPEHRQQVWVSHLIARVIWFCSCVRCVCVLDVSVLSVDEIIISFSVMGDKMSFAVFAGAG